MERLQQFRQAGDAKRIVCSLYATYADLIRACCSEPVCLIYVGYCWFIVIKRYNYLCFYSNIVYSLNPQQSDFVLFVPLCIPEMSRHNRFNRCYIYVSARVKIEIFWKMPKQVVSQVIPNHHPLENQLYISLPCLLVPCLLGRDENCWCLKAAVRLDIRNFEWPAAWRSQQDLWDKALPMP